MPTTRSFTAVANQEIPHHYVGICVDDVAQLIRSNRLQLNAGKTEFMWCVPPTN